jgi:hypothetical protein
MTSIGGYPLFREGLSSLASVDQLKMLQAHLRRLQERLSSRPALAMLHIVDQGLNTEAHGGPAKSAPDPAIPDHHVRIGRSARRSAAVLSMWRHLQLEQWKRPPPPPPMRRRRRLRRLHRPRHRRVARRSRRWCRWSRHTVGAARHQRGCRRRSRGSRRGRRRRPTRPVANEGPRLTRRRSGDKGGWRGRCTAG